MFSVMDMSHISLPTHVCKDTVIREKIVLKILLKIFVLKNIFVGMADHERKILNTKIKHKKPLMCAYAWSCTCAENLRSTSHSTW